MTHVQSRGTGLWGVVAEMRRACRNEAVEGRAEADDEPTVEVRAAHCRVVAWASSVLAVTGLSFWFFVGYPFGRYHEAYGWAAALNATSFADFVLTPTGHYTSYRPLGEAFAWVLYRLANEGMWAIQLFNYVVSSVAVVVSIHATRAPNVSAVAFLLTGGVFFRGFMYLFHLHGLYYSVVVLMIAVLVADDLKRSYSTAILARGFCVATVAGLFHAFAIVIWLGYFIGHLIERRKEAAKGLMLLGAMLLPFGALMVRVLVPGQLFHLDADTWSGLVGTYAMFGSNALVNAIAGLLMALTACGIPSPRGGMVLRVCGAFMVMAVLMLFQLPLLLGWVIVCVIKMGVMRRWSLLLMLIITSCFAIFTGTGSPHLLVFALVTCAVATPLGLEAFDAKLPWPAIASGPIALLLAASLAISLRLGVTIPVISHLARPLLIRQEQSVQLEQVIAWARTKGKADRRIIMDPGEGTDDALLPATQEDLDAYLASMRPKNVGGNFNSPPLVASFWGRPDEMRREAVLVIPGHFAGDVCVYEAALK